MIHLDIIKNYAQSFQDKMALIYDKNCLTWKQYHDYTSRVVSKLVTYRRIRKFSRVAFLSENSDKLIILGSAFTTIKIPFTGVDYTISLANLTRLVEVAQFDLIFISNKLMEHFIILNKILVGNVQLINIEDFFDNVSNFRCASSNDNEIDELTQANKFVSLSLTSGTTGIPKVIQRDKSVDKRRFRYFIDRFKFNSDDIYLCCMPMYHVSSTGWLKLFLSMSATCVITSDKSVYEIAYLLDNYKITATLLSGHMLYRLTQINIIEHSLKFILTGGKNLSSKVKKYVIERFGDILYEYYGTSETGVNTISEPKDIVAHPSSVGKEVDGSIVVIVDREGNVVAPLTVGRVAISSYMNMDSYLNATLNEIVIGNINYFLTSDYGYKDESGYIYLVQRSSIDSNILLDLFTIENELLNNENYKDLHILQINNSTEVIIYLSLNKYVPKNKLKKSIVSVLAYHGAILKELNIVEDIPYTLTGKVRLSAIL